MSEKKQQLKTKKKKKQSKNVSGCISQEDTIQHDYSQINCLLELTVLIRRQEIPASP